MLERLYSWLGLNAWVTRILHTVSYGAIAVEDRLLLARIEWEEEKRRLLRLTLLTIAALALTVVALIVVSLAVMASFWDTSGRLIAIWAVAGVWLVLWIGALATWLTTLKAGGKAFQATREELLKDWVSFKERL